MEETGLLNRESRNLNVTMEITLLIFTADEAKGNRQWDLQGPEGRLSSDRWETVSGHQTGYMMRIQHRIVVQAYNCYQYMKPVPAAANRTWANQPESAADPRQRQSAGKVLFNSFFYKSALRQCCVSVSVRCSSHQVWPEGLQASPSSTAPHQHVRRPGGQDQDQTETRLLGAKRWKRGVATRASWPLCIYGKVVMTFVHKWNVVLKVR